VGPCRPWGPASPRGPLGPVLPVGPIFPFAPGPPRGPAGPVGPRFPVLPFWIQLTFLSRRWQCGPDRGLSFTLYRWPDRLRHALNSFPDELPTSAVPAITPPTAAPTTQYSATRRVSKDRIIELLPRDRSCFDCPTRRRPRARGPGHVGIGMGHP